MPDDARTLERAEKERYSRYLRREDNVQYSEGCITSGTQPCATDINYRQVER